MRGVRLDPSHVRSVLVVRLDRMGDLLCTTPMLSAIKHLFPKARLTLVVSPYTAHLVEGSPVVDEVLVYPRKKYGGTLKEKLLFLKKLISKKFDLAFGPKSHLHPSQALLIGLSRASLRVGRKPKTPLRKLWQKTYNILLPPHLPGRHETEACLDLLRALGLKPGRFPSWVVIKPAYQKEIDIALEKRGLSQKFLGGIFFPKEDSRAIPWKELGNLLKTLTSTFSQIKFLLCCPPGLESEVQKIFPSLPLIATPHVQYLGALFKRLQFLITPDGGQAHLCAAVGTIPITLFTGDFRHLETWYPWGYKEFCLSLSGSQLNEKCFSFIIHHITTIWRKNYPLLLEPS